MCDCVFSCSSFFLLGLNLSPARRRCLAWRFTRATSHSAWINIAHNFEIDYVSPFLNVLLGTTAAGFVVGYHNIHHVCININLTYTRVATWIVIRKMRSMLLLPRDDGGQPTGVDVVKAARRRMMLINKICWWRLSYLCAVYFLV